MANASVEKLKALGLRHGEKAVVGLAAVLFFVAVGYAITRATLEMKPEELSTAANNASDLSRTQTPADVLAKLEKEGLVEPHLVNIVDNQLKNALKPDAYRPRLEWVTPEPGAGLIRDQPELIAPMELAAFPGRGGIQLFVLDPNGERIPDTGEEAKKKDRGRGKNARREEKPEDKKRREDEEEKRKELFAGKSEAEKEKAKAKEGAEADPAATGPWKEETKGKRWVVITGVIDNEQLKKNYLLALKNPAIAYPNYKRLDIERRNRQSDGSWTSWAAVDRGKSYDVIDNMTEAEAEYVPTSQLPEALVDPLPFLRAGYWTGVHAARLVPPDVLQGPANKAAGPGVGPGPGGGGSGSSRGGPPSGSGMAGGGMMGSPGGGGSPMQGSAGGRPGSGMMGPGGSGPGSGSSSGGGTEGEDNFTKIDEKALMLRSLDFTVDPDTTYQFRLRIVVVNPNLNHTDVNPGVDVEAKELLGPWSEPTGPVTLPADVAAYAQAPELAQRRNDLVTFQVIKWDLASGQTLVKNDGAGPGDLIGEYGAIPMPSSEGHGPKPATLDFNSRAVVLDTYGGFQRLPDIGVDRNQFMIPAVAMIIEPDGSVVIRDQATDKADEVRDDMESNYDQAIKDSGERRKKGSGSRMPGLGGGMRGPGSGGSRRQGSSGGSRSSGSQ